MAPKTTHLRPVGGSGRPVLALLCVAALVTVSALGSIQAATAPPIPVLPERQDGLSLVPRNWTVTGEAAGRVTMNGVQSTEEHPLAVRVGYRLVTVPGEVHALEGTLLIPDRVGGTEMLTSNTGARFHWVTFDPPLVLADGSVLRHIIPWHLEWTLDRSGVDDGLAYTLSASVPVPDEDGWSPPLGTTHPASGITLGLELRLYNTSREDPAGVPVSPANAHMVYQIQIPEDALGSGHPATDTNVTFSFRFDFARAVPGIQAHGPTPLDTNGIYLVQGQAAATLRFKDVSASPNATHTFTGRPGLADPHPDLRSLTPPLTANATLPLTRSLSGNEDALGASVPLELGYLYEYPPPPTPTPTPTPTRPAEENDTPVPGLVWMVLTLLALTAARCRARTHRH